MKLEHAERIVKAAADSGHELHLLKDYSGRGMFGKTTAAVTGEQGHVVHAIACAAVEMAHSSSGSADEDRIDDFLRAVGRLSWDEMGHDVIAY
jgi:hypothetical protein